MRVFLNSLKNFGCRNHSKVLLFVNKTRVIHFTIITKKALQKVTMKLPTCYVVLYIIWLLVIDFNVGKVTLENYMKKRNDLIQEEENIAFGRDVLLEENEEIVNGILMSTKFKEIEKGLFDFLISLSDIML